MFNLATNSKLRGIGYKALNVLRPCNIIALLAVTAASWVMIVMTGVTGQFFFFDAIAHVFISSIAMFLIITEVQFGPIKKYMDRSWPIFSERSGFFWLGTAMVVLGCDMLSNLNKPAFSVKNLGLPLWRLILAAGILAITFGFANFVVSVIFRDGPARLTARMIRADGNLADGGKLGNGISSGDSAYDNYYSASRSGSLGSRSGISRYNTKKEDAGYALSSPSSAAAAPLDTEPAPETANRFKRMTQAFKKVPFSYGNYGGHNAGSSNNDNNNGSGGGAKKFTISKPMPVGNYNDPNAYHGYSGDNHTPTNDDDVESAAADATDYDNSSTYEDRASPILPQVRRPPTALHPALSRHDHYSVANIPRF